MRHKDCDYDEIFTFLLEYFACKTPSLKEVVDTINDYYDAVDQTFDSYVYLLTFPSGKKYAGQTADYERRLAEHRRNKRHNNHMENAINNYSWDDIKKECCRIPTMYANVAEIFMIQFYDLMNKDKGYNKTSGGKCEYIYTDDVRERMSIAMKGVPKSEEHRVAISASWTCTRREEQVKSLKGVSRSDECRMAISSWWTEERRDSQRDAVMGINNPNYGKITPDYVKAKMRTSHIGNKNHNAKPVIVYGKSYGSSGEAARDAFTPSRNDSYVSQFIRRHLYSDQMFYISQEFYEFSITNKLENITRKMYILFERM